MEFRAHKNSQIDLCLKMMTEMGDKWGKLEIGDKVKAKKATTGIEQLMLAAPSLHRCSLSYY